MCKSNSITVNGSGKKRWKNKESRWQRRTEGDVKMKTRRRDEIWAAKRERDKKKRETQPIVDLSFYICPSVLLCDGLSTGYLANCPVLAGIGSTPCNPKFIKWMNGKKGGINNRAVTVG